MQSEKWCVQGHLNYCRPFQQSCGFVLNGNAMIKCCDEEFNLAMLYELYTNKEKLVAKYFKNKCVDQKKLFKQRILIIYFKKRMQGAEKSVLTIVYTD